ncbi:MAG: hypothetical protein ACJ77K_08795 [Bacteroidia bacterium]
MGKLLAFLLIFSSFWTVACDCPPSPAVNKQEAQKYDVVFYGTVDSVFGTEKADYGKAFFTVKELYKGNCPGRFTLNFEFASACMMSFSKGEEWIIYANYEKFDLLKTNFCGLSRKLPSAGEQDLYAINGRPSFDNEELLLKASFGLQPFVKENEINKQHEEMGPRNEQPSGNGKIILLLISLAVMGVVWYLTRKKK